MNTELVIRICREINAEVDGKWFLFEHGTYVQTKNVPEADDAYVIKIMRSMSDMIGPYGGEGGELGDCGAQRLRKYDGYVVSFSLPLLTLVLTSELESVVPTSPTEVFQAPEGAADAADFGQRMRVAVFGRHKRNLDCASPKIIARSTDA